MKIFLYRDDLSFFIGKLGHDFSNGGIDIGRIANYIFFPIIEAQTALYFLLEVDGGCDVSGIVDTNHIQA